MILVTGGTGFVGREVVRQLAETGHSVRLLVRNPDRARELFPSTSCELVQGDILDKSSLETAMRGVRAVIHLVGIISECGGSSYQQIHVEGTRNVIDAAKSAGVKRYLHMSAIGTRPHAPAPYHQTKWQAEEIVRSSGLAWTIIRPSIIYGPKDHFTTLISLLLHFPFNLLTLFALPCPNDGETQLQPVPVGDVARSFIRALSNQAAVGKTYELGGETITYSDMVIAIARAAGQNPKLVDATLPVSLFLAPLLLLRGYRPLLLPLPSALVKTGAWLFEIISPIPLLNYGHALMIEEDHHADTAQAREDLAFVPANFKDNLGYLSSK